MHQQMMPTKPLNKLKKLSKQKKAKCRKTKAKSDKKPLALVFLLSAKIIYIRAVIKWL
jgi:hypothetical protein